MASCSFGVSKPIVCTKDCVQLICCDRDISRHLQTYQLNKSRDIQDEIDLLLCRAGDNVKCL